MKKTLKMQIAKATKDDIGDMIRYFNKAEARGVKSLPCGWRRVVLAADILIDKCCNPDVDHLELKPELLNQGTNPETSVATKSASSTKAGKPNPSYPLSDLP